MDEEKEKPQGEKNSKRIRYRLLKRVDEISRSEELDLIFRHWIEELPIALHFIRWFILSASVGLIIGIGVRFFLWLLEYSIHLLKEASPKYYYLMPLGFAISAFLIHTFAREAEGHGTEKVIEAVHKRAGKIAPVVVPVKALATIVTIATGGSAGKEGPSAQIGAAIASIFSDYLKLSAEDRKKLVICGISAAFASVFGTPIAGAIFGVEVLFLGNLLYDVMFPSFIAGMTSFYVTKNVLKQHYFFENLRISIPNLHVDHILLLKTIAVGIIIAFLAIIFIEFLELAEIWKKRLKALHPVLRSALAALVLVILTELVGTRYLGLGLEDIGKAFTSLQFSLWDSVLKMIYTAITLSFGSGGIITPIFYIGATAGNALASILHLHPSLAATLGLAAMISASANTPIAASLMAIELFGGDIASLAAIASIVSFVIVGYKSVYPTQVISIRKVYEVKVPIGVDIHTAEHAPVESEIYARYLSIAKRKRFIKKLLEVLWYIREPLRTLKCRLKVKERELEERANGNEKHNKKKCPEKSAPRREDINVNS